MGYFFADFLGLSKLGLSFTEICLRLACAMVVGLVIGAEREHTHRPAGMRTHILVALGSCVVMIIGEIIFKQYQAYGATPDPARLGAQVISGVSFLGAGTIMREGVNVKGLTTAASIWTVACLGLASGAGYYAVALMGMLFVFITLTVFETLQRKFFISQNPKLRFCIETNSVGEAMSAIEVHARACRMTIRDTQVEQSADGTYSISLQVSTRTLRTEKKVFRLTQKLIGEKSITSIRQLQKGEKFQKV